MDGYVYEAVIPLYHGWSTNLRRLLQIQVMDAFLADFPGRLSRWPCKTCNGWNNTLQNYLAPKYVCTGLQHKYTSETAKTSSLLLLCTLLNLQGTTLMCHTEKSQFCVAVFDWLLTLAGVVMYRCPDSVSRAWAYSIIYLPIRFHK